MLPIATFCARLWLLAASLGSISAQVRDLIAAREPDSLVVPLGRFELAHPQSTEGGEAAFVLGQLHYARGEYRQACDAFSRAAAKLEPERRTTANYWAGLSWLALKQPDAARAALEEVAKSDEHLRAGAMLGVALAWEMSNQPDQALQALEGVLAGAPGEAGAAALELEAALADRLKKDALARGARERLAREYPKSIEATRVSLPAAAPPPAPAAEATVTVQIGAFADPARARALAESAQKSGFTGAAVMVKGEGDARMNVVTLGVFSTREEARRAGERAAAALGVAYQVVRFP